MPIQNDSSKKSLFDPEEERQCSGHSKEMTTYLLDFGISDKLRKTHIAPIVIISTPESEVETPSSITSTTIDPVIQVKHPATTHPTDNAPPNKHSKHQDKKERRPSIVKRNIRKIFRK